ncbi:MAG: metallophosphoesterase family protein, partial [Thermoplasmata archaeon]
VLEELKKHDYDLLIHSGDLTQDGKLEYYKKAQKFLKKIDIPYVIIPGNHDKRSGGISLYQDYVGSPNGVEDIGDAVVIYVDSAIHDSNIGRVGMVKFDMIKQALDEHTDKEIKIVVLHHHTIPIPMAGRERNVLSNAGDLLDLFLRSDVDLVISGHRHYPNVYRVENTVFVNAGTVSGRKTRYGDVNSYNIIDIDEDELSVKTNRIGRSTKINTFPRDEKRVFYEFGERKFSIVHMSNSFISSSTKFRYTHFFNALNKINYLDVDLIVHCGGIVKEGITKDYDLADKYMSKFDAPIVYTPAGRDINYLGYNLFSEYFGNMDQRFSDDNVLLQGINSAQYDSPIGIIGTTEREALFQKLKERDESFKCIFLHHNVLPIPHAREKGLLEDSGDLLRGVVDEKIDLVLTGTSSHPFSAKIGDTITVNANSISSVYQRSVHGNSFNLIDIYEKVVVVSEINSLWGTRRIMGMWQRNSH